MREIKFHEVLAELIASRGLARKRKELADALHVSASAITQYTTARSRPSFDVLLALADYFDVSLDYLVFGVEVAGSTEPPDALLRYFDRALTRSQELNLQRAAAVVDVGRLLAEQVEAAVDRVIQERGGFLAGTLADDETLELEGFARAVDLASIDLAYDISVGEDGTPTHGRFLSAVAANLAAGHPYRVLLPPERDWEPTVRTFRSLLAEASSGDAVGRHLKIKVAHTPFFAGVGIYDLDVEGLERKSPNLWLKVRAFAAAGNKLAYVIAPSSAILADCLFDSDGVTRAAAAFESAWKQGSPI